MAWGQGLGCFQEDNTAQSNAGVMEVDLALGSPGWSGPGHLLSRMLGEPDGFERGPAETCGIKKELSSFCSVKTDAH